MKSTPLTPALILDELMLDSMSDAKLLEFATYHYKQNLTDKAEYPGYTFDVDDEHIIQRTYNDQGEIVSEKPGYINVKIEALDGAFKWGRKVRYKSQESRHAHFHYDQDLNAARTEIFSWVYPYINQQIIEKGDFVPSRNGATREFLNFKTIIDRPWNRCAGGFNRNMNIFFLLAEAIWIVRGRQDVAFLTLFNKQMAEYSDDGKTFHAAYGYRIRKARSFVNPKQTNDQFVTALESLAANAEDRRVVVSIWDQSLDQGTQSKDIPCNDMLMFKVRGGKLYTTVQNRSNDLHWGLPTNVFQFSFLTEVMARLLHLQEGQQVHNSQSLHVYVSNPIAEEMYRDYQNMAFANLADLTTETMPIDFHFPDTGTESATIRERVAYLDSVLDRIFRLVEAVAKNTFVGSKAEHVGQIKTFSSFLAYLTELLIIYVDYTRTSRTDENRVQAISQIVALRADPAYDAFGTDYEFMAINFFAARLKVPHDIQSVNGNYGTL